MQEKKYNEIKKEVRSVLITYPRGVTLEEFLRTYKDLLGQRLPSRALGFSSDIQFLQSMPDVVSVCTDACGKIQLTGIADEKSQHIQKLVSKQRTNKPNGKQPGKRQPTWRPTSSKIFEVKNSQPYLPGPLRAEILQLMTVFQNGVGLPAFAIAYRSKFNKFLPLVKGLDTLEEMIKLIPQLEIKVVNNEKRICCKTFKSDETIPQAENSLNIHESGISDEILKHFQQIVQKCSDGILDIHFPPLYENITGKSFDIHEFGYKSILDLVDALPHIFKRTLNHEDNNRWIILPADSSAKHCLTVDDSHVNNNRKQSSPKSGRLPSDASSPSLQYIQPSISENLDLTLYVPIFVSAILNPSLFWFQLQTDEVSKSFELFEKDLGSFYDLHSFDYKMNDVDIVIGASCVILCPEDKQWYRAVIKSILSLHLVNVSFVDYGSTENIPRDNLFYARSKYHDYPACAFKAQLASVKPSQNASIWSLQAQQKFIQLCSCGILMANLKSVNKDTYSIYLCDTNGEKDIFLNDVLINEGFAELSCDSDPDEKYNSSESSLEETDIYNEIKPHSLSELPSRSDQDMQLNKIDSTSESESLDSIKSLNRRLSFSSKEILSTTIASSSTPSSKGQHSKRFVKLLQLCEETKMHFINLENKLYMSYADISKFMWNDRDSDFLIERLKYKEVDVPFLKLSKEEYTELFNQCIWYRIPEFERLKAHNSTLIMCPLEWALNILNIFGHPSVCFRLAIQDEIRKFDPFDPIWKEFCDEDPYVLNDMEREIEQKINKLCLYDLRAKNEALKIKRLKLLRIENNAESEEIKMVEMHQKIIGRRMKQIEAVCIQYSSCP